MAKTVVGLFDDPTEAQGAGKDLETLGVIKSDLNVYAASDSSRVSYALTEAGVPGDDAGLYAEGVRRGETLVTARTADDLASEAVEIMNRRGAIDIDQERAYYQTTQTAATTGYAATTDYGKTATAAGTPKVDTLGTGTVDTSTVNTGGETVIPITEEQLAVGKRQVQRGGARIHTFVTETPVEQSVTLREEHVTVQRHAVDRAVTSGDTAFQATDITLTETAEVPVVAKEARVVEEVVVGKTATDRTETVRDTVRRTDVEVEEIPGTTTTTGTTTTGR